MQPVNLKFCVDAEWLESTVALGLIENIDNLDELSDTLLRAYLDSKAVDQKSSLTLDMLDSIIGKELCMVMTDKSAKARMESLFVSYLSILRRNGLAWVPKVCPKVAVNNVLSAVKPGNLQESLQSDLRFAHQDLRKDFKSFMQHAVKLSIAFEIVDIGPRRDRASSTDSRRNGNRSTDRDSTKGTPQSSNNSRQNNRPKKFIPACPFPSCMRQKLMHWIDDCPKANDAEKRQMKKDLAAKRAQDGPARSTRGQKTRVRFAEDAASRGTTGRLSNTADVDTSSCIVTVSDGLASLDTAGRCDDGSDESLVSPSLAERAAMKGIGKLSSIAPVRLQVALKKEEQEAQTFSFSRTWTAPRTILHLASGQLALVNIKFLVADDDLACEDLLIGRPVLHHLQIDTKTLLELSRKSLDGTDCSNVGRLTLANRGGYVSRIMVSRLNHIRTEEKDLDPDHPRINYFTARSEPDPFPDPSLLDPLDENQHNEIQKATSCMVQSAHLAGLSVTETQDLQDLVNANIDIFRTGLSSGPPADIKPLKIELTQDAHPVQVRLRNYSQTQREFLAAFVDKLVRNGLAYPNPTSPWACAPLLVLKPGPSQFRFTVDLRPVNKFTIRHQYPMPNLEHELCKVSGSSFFASFDLSNGYWQLPLEESSQQLQYFITPDGVYTPTRVLHGTTNAVAHLQSSLAEIIPPVLWKSLLSWLDDILLHHETFSGLLQAISDFFDTCASHRLRLHPGKCVLFSHSIRWCGRQISADGVRYNPRRLDGLLNMAPPVTGANLQQFICALQWVKSAIPDFSKPSCSTVGFPRKRLFYFWEKNYSCSWTGTVIIFGLE